jgi:DNA-binding NtrC family response regulator
VGAIASEPYQTEFARTVQILAEQAWGPDRGVHLIGRHPAFIEALERVERLGEARAPVLITGETGTGKELFARALFLVSRNYRRAFVPINCAQYVNGELTASELFGHRKGSFTGAVNSHGGIFQDAEGGTVFLDEVGELSAAAQGMLLRVLGEGEIIPVGSTQPKHIDIRVIAATNRNLLEMVQRGTFREDLYFRLQRLKVRVPPLRERGEDWQLILDYLLRRLSEDLRRTKRLGSETISYLRRYDWPGNVREVQACVETGYHLSDGSEIGIRDLVDALEATSRAHEFSHISAAITTDYCTRMKCGEADFWQLIYHPFMERDLSRAEVQEVIAEGLANSRGSYKTLLPAFGIADSDYLKFMDFLRHHRLKPNWGARPMRGEGSSLT